MARRWVQVANYLALPALLRGLLDQQGLIASGLDGGTVGWKVGAWVALHRRFLLRTVYILKEVRQLFS